jgi:hypothetical protein
MYRSFEIRNYRCFPDLTLGELERVNLIAGMNNVGKTALLEALFIHSGAYNPELTLRVSALRGIEPFHVQPAASGPTPWDVLFHALKVEETIELVGHHTRVGRREVRLKLIRDPADLPEVGLPVQAGSRGSGSLPSSAISCALSLECRENGNTSNYFILDESDRFRVVPVPPVPPFPAFLRTARGGIDPGDAERFSRLHARKEKEAVIQTLRIIEPRLCDLAIAVIDGVAIIHGDIGLESLLPLAVMGEGMVRLASLAMIIAETRHGIVLVDEMENGLHHSILPQVWKAIALAARRFDAQVFATTHSLECIIAAHQAFSEDRVYDFRLHRLERVGDTIRARCYDQETLQAAIETGMEVR